MHVSMSINTLDRIDSALCIFEVFSMCESRSPLISHSIFSSAWPIYPLIANLETTRPIIQIVFTSSQSLTLSHMPFACCNFSLAVLLAWSVNDSAQVNNLYLWYAIRFADLFIHSEAMIHDLHSRELNVFFAFEEIHSFSWVFSWFCAAFLFDFFSVCFFCLDVVLVRCSPKRISGRIVQQSQQNSRLKKNRKQSQRKTNRIQCESMAAGELRWPRIR